MRRIKRNCFWGIVIVIGIFILFFAFSRKENSIEEHSIEENKISAIDNAENTNIPEGYTVVAPNAELYYEQNSKVVSSIEANNSDDVLTEMETYNLLTERGFTQFPIVSSYLMDGEYYRAEEITDSSSTKHPIYETYYVTTNGDLWTIFMINGAIMANPVSYNLELNSMEKVIVSEVESVMSYDSTTNRFYKTIPDASALLVIAIGEIDVSLLEKLTVGEIDRYVN